MVLNFKGQPWVLFLMISKIGFLNLYFLNS